MDTFKYKIIKTPTELSEARLNALGKQGWELVSVIGDTYGYTYYIKKKDGKNSI